MNKSVFMTTRNRKRMKRAMRYAKDTLRSDLKSATNFPSKLQAMNVYDDTMHYLWDKYFPQYPEP